MDELDNLDMWETLFVDDELQIQRVPHGFLYKSMRFRENIYEIAHTILVKEDND